MTMAQESVPMILPLATAWEQPFADFLVRLAANGDEATFHPHPLTRESAAQLANYSGRDLYYVFVDQGQVLGYGMLRGWDEGFEVPSLGIAIDPSVRGRRIGLALMHFLHAVAKQRGCSSIRLTVSATNLAAIRLYEGLGYRFEPIRDTDLVGKLGLTSG